MCLSQVSQPWRAGLGSGRFHRIQMSPLRSILCRFAQQHLRLRRDLQLLGAGKSSNLLTNSAFLQKSNGCPCGQMHFLLYGTGMQTWEYSPLYAIRSYAYLWLHALPACLHAHVLQTNKVAIEQLCVFLQQLHDCPLLSDCRSFFFSFFLSSLCCRCWCSTLCGAS